MIKKKKRKIIKKRKKIVKKKRNNNDEEKPIIRNWGGHLPTPPEDCERSEYIFVDRGTRWIDLGICFGCSIQNSCKRRKAYLRYQKTGV